MKRRRPAAGPHAAPETTTASTPRMTRREFVAAGSLALAGGSLAAPAAAAQAASSPAGAAGFGRAKSVVVLYLYGAPSQMDTLDPKPDAPVETRGEFGTIASSLAGVRVCEHLPHIARNLHRMALVRSMTHASNNHAVSVALSGLSASEPAIEANGQDPRHQPYFGSILEYVWQKRGVDAAATGVPIHMILPWSLNARSDPKRWSPHAAWLGRNYNPVMPVFAGQGSRAVGNPSAQGPTPILSRFDPYDGVTPDSTFRFDGAALAEGMSEDRLADRRRLLERLERQRRAALAGQGEAFAHYRDAAFHMIADPRVARAVDVTREPMAVRERYGLTLFGQEALAARRLIESGVKVVTAFWDDYAFGNNAWDTHFNHFPRLKQGLCPIFDQVLPAFLGDMHERGLLDETLVMVISEHGRTPEIKRCPGGGREHWAGAYWGLFFGAGIKTDQVIGGTDRQGGYPTSHPTDPKDILATMYHLLSIDPHTTTIPDSSGRPIHLIPHGDVVRELLA